MARRVHPKIRAGGGTTKLQKTGHALQSRLKPTAFLKKILNPSPIYGRTPSLVLRKQIIGRIQDAVSKIESIERQGHAVERSAAKFLRIAGQRTTAHAQISHEWKRWQNSAWLKIRRTADELRSLQKQYPSEWLLHAKVVNSFAPSKRRTEEQVKSLSNQLQRATAQRRAAIQKEIDHLLREARAYTDATIDRAEFARLYHRTEYLLPARQIGQLQSYIDAMQDKLREAYRIGDPFRKVGALSRADQRNMTTRIVQVIDDKVEKGATVNDACRDVAKSHGMTYTNVYMRYRRRRARQVRP